MRSSFCRAISTSCSRECCSSAEAASLQVMEAICLPDYLAAHNWQPMQQQSLFASCKIWQGHLAQHLQMLMASMTADIMSCDPWSLPQAAQRLIASKRTTQHQVRAIQQQHSCWLRGVVESDPSAPRG